MIDKQQTQTLLFATAQLATRGYAITPDALEEITTWLQRAKPASAVQGKQLILRLIDALREPTKKPTSLSRATVQAAIKRVDAVKDIRLINLDLDAGSGTRKSAMKCVSTEIHKTAVWAAGKGVMKGFTGAGAPNVAKPRIPVGRKSAMGRSPFGMSEPTAPPPAPPPPPSPPPPPPPSIAPVDTPRTQRAKPPAPTELVTGANTKREPPRSAYALVDAPDAVVVGDEFDVVVGLSEIQGTGVTGEALVLPATTDYPYTLTLQLVAAGFEAVDGGAWRQDVIATEDDPYPRTNFHLRAAPLENDVQARLFQVIYSTGGQTIGFAVRPIAVLSTKSRAKATVVKTTGSAVDVSVPTELHPADLTIRIVHDANAPSRLLWTFDSPHDSIKQLLGDAKPESSDIGSDPDQFAKQLVQQVNLQEGKPGLKLQMKGIAKTVAEQIPDLVWQAIYAAAAQVKGVPSILIVSAEPYVPWELAKFDAPLADPAAPAFLGAQTNIGRWVFREKKTELPPPNAVDVTSMAVIWGKYTSSKWQPLKSAEEEAAELQKTYGAISIDATIDPVVACLDGDPPATALHFAIHGIYSPDGIQNGLVLTDDATISPVQVSGGTLSARPFVFLNACQVGSGSELLGDYAGTASAFLQARASAVVAPLWSIKDTIAKEISLEFYEQAFSGVPVAEVMRKQRAKYGTDNSATYLAYQYFGHPNLRLTRK